MSRLTATTPGLPGPGVWSRLLGGHRRQFAAPDFPLFAGTDWADRVMDEPVTDRFHAKQGRSIGRWTLSDEDGRQLTVYLKRHYVLPRWQGLLAAVTPGRAWSAGWQELEHLTWAAGEGIPVPRAVAAAEYGGPWGRLQSALAVEELTDMLPLNEAIPLAAEHLSPSAFLVWKRRLIAEVARLSREFHRRQAFHKDLYLCHFYLPTEDCQRVPPRFAGRVWVIDLHRLGRHSLLSRYFQVKDIAQLLYSAAAVPELTARDRLRFWRLYTAGDWSPGRPPSDWLQGAVRWKFKRYQRHNARKRGAA